MKWNERLRAWIKADGRGVEALAALANVKPDTIYKWQQGKVKNPQNEDRLNALLTVLGRKQIDLFFDSAEIGNSQNRGVIALISMSSLRGLKPGDSPRDKWDGNEVVEAPDGVGSQAVAVRLDNDDGVLGDPRDQTEFLAGDIIVLELDKPALPGSLVFAIAENPSIVLFGQYRPTKIGDASEFSIRAPNPHYPEVEISEENPGFVIGRATKLIRNL